MIYNINDNIHLRGEAYGFFPIQEIMDTYNTHEVFYHDKIFTTAHLMALTALVVQTPVGPLSVEMNYYDKPGQKWFFSLNMGYMLFNKRGF
jgi:NTE family protein